MESCPETLEPMFICNIYIRIWLMMRDFFPRPKTHSFEANFCYDDNSQGFASQVRVIEKTILTKSMKYY